MRWRKTGVAIAPPRGLDLGGVARRRAARRALRRRVRARVLHDARRTSAARTSRARGCGSTDDGVPAGVDVQPDPVLSPGPRGTFDDSGTMTSCLVRHDGVERLYYQGWALGVTVPFYVWVGCASRAAGSAAFERVSPAPVLGPHAHDPIMCSSPWVRVEEGLAHVVRVQPRVGGRAGRASRVPRATSATPSPHDGIEWERDGRVCIDFAGPGETALSRPVVLRDADRYRMWFSHRGAPTGSATPSPPTASTWERRDDLAGIDVSRLAASTPTWSSTRASSTTAAGATCSTTATASARRASVTRCSRMASLMAIEEPDLSVVVPVYGCADCLEALCARLLPVLDAHVGDWEVVFVDDASRDGAWEVIEAVVARDGRVRGIQLSRNFGQHAAITAGMAETRGREVVVMDCDLQDPPEDIPRLIAAAREGFDVVLTKRDRRRQSWPRRAGAKLYLRARNALLGTTVDPELSTLSLISRGVVDAFLGMGDRDRQYMLILHWLGFRRTVIGLTHSDRHAGKSSYTLSKLMRVAVDGLFFQTTALLRWVVYLGFGVATAGVVLAAVFIALFFVGRPLPGFTSLAVLILVVGGFIIVSTGIMGLYVGKIFEQVKGRPVYVVGRRAGQAGEAGAPRAVEDQAAPPG